MNEWLSTCCYTVFHQREANLCCHQQCDNLIEYITAHLKFSKTDVLKNILSCYHTDPRKYFRNSNILASKLNLLGCLLYSQPYQKKKKNLLSNHKFCLLFRKYNHLSIMLSIFVPNITL